MENKTQRQIVTEHILKYGHITRNEAIGMYGITRLAAIMHHMAKEYKVPVISQQKKKDYSYTFRYDFLNRIRELKQAKDLMEKNNLAFIH